MSTVCVFCEQTASSKLEITVDDGKVIVGICDLHAEDATIKSCRTAYLQRQTQIAELLAQAEKLGLKLSTTASGITLAQTEPQTLQEPRVAQLEQPVRPTPPPLADNNHRLIPTSQFDNRQHVPQVKVIAEGGLTVDNYASHSLSNLADKLPEGARIGEVLVEQVAGRAGVPVNVETLRRDGTGETKITVRQTVDDSRLQRRFKEMAVASLDGIYQDGYALEPTRVRSCPFCGGRGQYRANNNLVECQKCHGTGSITV